MELLLMLDIKIKKQMTKHMVRKGNIVFFIDWQFIFGIAVQCFVLHAKLMRENCMYIFSSLFCPIS